MKNIIYIGGFELPNKNAAAIRVLSNSKILRELGYNVILLGVNKSQRPDSGLIKSEEDWEGFESYTIPYPNTLKAWFSHLIGCRHQYQFLKEQKDIHAVIYYNFPFMATLRLSKLMKGKNAKNISDITEWYSAKGMGLVKGGLKFLDTNLRVKRIAKECDGIITTSKYLTNYYNSLNLKTLELPTLFDSVDFAMPNRQKNSSKVLFLYVGSPFEVNRAIKDRSSVKERLDIIVKSFALQPHSTFELQIVGVSLEDYLRVYPEDSIVIERMSDDIKFLGRIPNDEVKKILNFIDFTVFFRDENQVTLAGFPSKLAESITAGVPVVTNYMVSIEPYMSNEAIFCAERTKESSLISNCINLSTEKINNLKKYAYESKTFDYREYVESTSKFFKEI